LEATVNPTEETAMEIAKINWQVYSGCKCTPKPAKRGSGCDLQCDCKRVEVKGTKEAIPGHRFITKEGKRAAEKDEHFELWLVADIEGKRTVYVIPNSFLREETVEVTHYRVPLGKKRLESFREEAENRKKRRQVEKKL
jgi:hypothetical protein